MLEIDLDQKIRLDLQRDIIGRQIAVLGESTTGKTNITAVLVEELLAARLPLTIVDNEGKYRGLQNVYPVLMVGCSEQADFQAETAKAASLAELSVRDGLSMILDLSELPSEEQTDFLLAYFSSLWAALSKKRTPYEVVFEEVHKFISQEVRVLSPLKELLNMFALHGHKRSLGAIFTSQRATGITASILTHAEMLFLHQVVNPGNLQFL